MNNRIKERSLIEQRVASIFVHVTDLRRAAEWYNKLLGLPLLEDRFNGGPVYWYNFPDTNLILDNNAANRENPEWREAMKPRIMFNTADIDKAYAFVKERGQPIYGPEYHGDIMAYFNFFDPEGNAHMVCWTSSNAAEAGPVGSSPILPRISAAFIDVKDMPVMADWYSELLGISNETYKLEKEIVTLPVTRGSSILLDANRHLQGNDYTIPFMFATDDLEASLSFVKNNGFELFGEPQYYGPVSFFILKDPDGNLVMVCRYASESEEPDNKKLSTIKKGINGIFVYVRDLESACEWYERCLGFERGPHDFSSYCELRKDGEYSMHLLKAEEDVGPLNRPTFSFDTEDIDAAHQNLTTYGTEVFPIQQYGDHRSFDFEDLEGNRLMICQFD